MAYPLRFGDPLPRSQELRALQRDADAVLAVAALLGRGACCIERLFCVLRESRHRLRIGAGRVLQASHREFGVVLERGGATSRIVE